MVFLLLVSVLFSKTPYLLGGIGGRGGIKMASDNTQSANIISPQGPPFSPHSTAKKPIIKASIKAQISGKLVSSGINDVAFASVYSAKTRLK